MSLPYSATPTPGKALTIDVRSRRSERRIVVLALGGVAVSAMLLSLPVLLLAAVVVALGFQSQGWLGGADRVTAVSWLSDGRWILTGADRKNIPATLSADTRIGNGWLWLRWHTEREVRSMLLLKGDALPAELRRLNARLRLEMGA